jgi:hypothetical protein
MCPSTSTIPPAVGYIDAISPSEQAITTVPRKDMILGVTVSRLRLEGLGQRSY